MGDAFAQHVVKTARRKQVAGNYVLLTAKVLSGIIVSENLD
jgi:hypothetical protein